VKKVLLFISLSIIALTSTEVIGNHTWNMWGAIISFTCIFVTFFIEGNKEIALKPRINDPNFMDYGILSFALGLLLILITVEFLALLCMIVHYEPFETAPDIISKRFLVWLCMLVFWIGRICTHFLFRWEKLRQKQPN